MNTLTKSNVRLFASSNSWIEGEGVRQLYAAAKLDGMRLAIGFPDLHPGKGSPVGSAFVTEGSSLSASCDSSAPRQISSGTAATTASPLVSTKVKLFGSTARELWQPKAKPWSSPVRAVRSVTWSSLWVMAKAVPGLWLTVQAASGPEVKLVSACASGSGCIS